MEAWDTNQRLYKEAAGGEFSDDDKRRIFKKMLPDLMREQLTMQVAPHDTWENLKSFVLERARQLAMDSHSKPLNLAEATVPSQEPDIAQELNALVNPSTEDILAVVNRRMNGEFAKAPMETQFRRESR